MLLKKHWKETKDESSPDDAPTHQHQTIAVHAGISHNMWYHIKKPRNIPADPVVSKMVQDIGTARPTYGKDAYDSCRITRAACACEQKEIHQIFHMLSWIEPAKTKSEIIRSGKKLLRSTDQTRCSKLT
jgi:hypothetical protein